MNNLVPSLGFSYWVHPKMGRMIKYYKNTAKVQSVKTKRDRSIYGQGPILFNALPRCIREHEGTFKSFKALVDIVLDLIPDRPCLNGYRNGNNDIFDKETNTIPIWISNLKLQEWTPPNDLETYSIM